MASAVYYRPDGSVIESGTVGDKYDIEAEARRKGPDVSAIRVDEVQHAPGGKKHKVVNGQIVLVDDQEFIDKKRRRDAAILKVKARLLLTDEEFNLGFGG